MRSNKRSQTKVERSGDESRRDHTLNPSTVDGTLPNPSLKDLGADITFDSPDQPINSRGRFSDVYLGTHRTKGKVALKRLRRLGTSVPDDAALEVLFCKETDTWIGFKHDYILPCLGSFTLNGHRYFVSPFMERGTLFEWVKPENKGKDRLRLIYELSDALCYIHSKSIVHGDVKADNVLLSDDLHVQLCDFGLAKVAETKTITRIKGAGSFRWQSPELWYNKQKTSKSDVYAFAMTIVEVLTGQVPFVELIHDPAVMMAVVGNNNRPARNPLVSSDGTSYAPAWDVAEKAWCYDASDRISMEEAVELLRHFAVTRITKR